jgi:hypothetical protein
MEQQAREQAFISALTTEQFVLQAARSANVGEMTGPGTVYMGAVSSALIALGFLAQCDRRDQQHRGRGRGGVAGRQGGEPGHGRRAGGRHRRRRGPVRAPPALSAAASRLPGPAATGPAIVGLVVELDPAGRPAWFA